MSAWLGAIAGATAAYMEAEAQHLRSLPPEERRCRLRERRLEYTDEVRAAREAIRAEGLRGPYAETLLEEARRLAEAGQGGA